MTVIKIINNRIHNLYPTDLYKCFILFSILTFLIGLVAGYTLRNYLLYNALSNLIYNNGILIFDDRYYQFVEISKEIIENRI